jgi:hypothetical protein
MIDIDGNDIKIDPKGLGNQYCIFKSDSFSAFQKIYVFMNFHLTISSTPWKERQLIYDD